MTVLFIVQFNLGFTITVYPQVFILAQLAI